MTSDSDSDMDMGEGMGEAGDVDIVDAAWWAEQQRIRGFVSPMKEDADRDFSWMCSNCTFQNAAGMWQCTSVRRLPSFPPLQDHDVITAHHTQHYRPSAPFHLTQKEFQLLPGMQRHLGYMLFARDVLKKKALQRVQNLKRRCFVRLTIAGA